MTRTRQHDNLNRLQRVSSAASGETLPLAFWAGVTNVATFGSSQPITGGVYTARSSETISHITYDADGNPTGDSLWSYVWDGENRLVQMEMKTGTGISGATPKRLTFQYDRQGRRIQKVVENHSGGVWTHEYTRRFPYDGWNLIAGLDGNNDRIRTYVWGTDLSGSQQRAGGVGGLLMVPQFTPSVSPHFVAHDGDGNVMCLVNAADGRYSARYAYGPFGEPLRISAAGAMDKKNPFRYSTKYTNDESGMLYYGYRYYDPSTGRRPNRDPIEEADSSNLIGKQAGSRRGDGSIQQHGVRWADHTCNTRGEYESLL